VETVAEGPRDLLEMLLADLKRGPSHAIVTKVDEQWSTATGESKDFRMRR
jgi:acylphosphatase